jgi:carbon-monoxide dehydrogenase catalytic subunit
MAEATKPKEAALPPVQDLTICDSTAKMLTKARQDGVITAFDRAAAMKPCPIGADAACCKHCFMGPCRLNPNDPYAKVGVCGATADTIQARNFGRTVAAGTAAHTDHGMVMLELFRQVALGHIPEYSLQDTEKLYDLAAELNIATEGRSDQEIALNLADVLERTYTQIEGEIPFAVRVPEKTLEAWKKQFSAEMTLDAVTCDGCTSGGCHGGYTGECPIRACGMAKGIANCGLCPEYSCEKLDAFVVRIPGGRARLDAARANK